MNYKKKIKIHLIKNEYYSPFLQFFLTHREILDSLKNVKIIIILLEVWTRKISSLNNPRAWKDESIICNAYCGNKRKQKYKHIIVIAFSLCSECNIDLM